MMLPSFLFPGLLMRILFSVRLRFGLRGLSRAFTLFGLIIVIITTLLSALVFVVLAIVPTLSIVILFLFLITSLLRIPLVLPLFLCLRSQDTVLVIFEPRFTDAPLVVASVVERVGSRESHQVARAFLDTLEEVLRMAGETFLRERSHLTAAQVVLGVQIEKVEQVEVDLGAMVRRVRLSAKLHVALLIAVKDVCSGAEGREDLTQLVMLVWLEKASGNLVHRGHGAAWGHVDPQCGQEAKDTTFQVLRMHHDVHFVLRVARVDSIREATIVVVPFHLEGTTRVILRMFKGWPCLCGPAMRVEVALHRAVERREPWVLSTVVILDVLEALSEILMMVWLRPISLENNVRE